MHKVIIFFMIFSCEVLFLHSQPIENLNSSLPINSADFPFTDSYSSIDSKKIPLDHKLIQKINRPNGFFIEVGGLDGVTQSNTMLFEKYLGWRGILIEPSPKLYPVLCENRPRSVCISCALGSFEEHNTYVYGDFIGYSMSSVNGARLRSAFPLNPMVEVYMRSLQSILDDQQVSHIDFFSLDTEGYEFNILNGIDFDRTTFDYILIEIYTHDYEKIIDFMLKKGYVCVENFTNYNRIDNPGWDGSHNDYLFQPLNTLNNSL